MGIYESEQSIEENGRVVIKPVHIQSWMRHYNMRLQF